VPAGPFSQRVPAIAVTKDARARDAIRDYDRRNCDPCVATTITNKGIHAAAKKQSFFSSRVKSQKHWKNSGKINSLMD